MAVLASRESSLAYGRSSGKCPDEIGVDFAVVPLIASPAPIPTLTCRPGDQCVLRLGSSPRVIPAIGVHGCLTYLCAVKNKKVLLLGAPAHVQGQVAAKLPRRIFVDGFSIQSSAEVPIRCVPNFLLNYAALAANRIGLRTPLLRADCKTF
jgi:hypothetical protein